MTDLNSPIGSNSIFQESPFGYAGAECHWLTVLHVANLWLVNSGNLLFVMSPSSEERILMIACIMCELIVYNERSYLSRTLPSWGFFYTSHYSDQEQHSIFEFQSL